MADSPSHATAEHIGSYRLEAHLGRGGMGEVYLGWDERLERRVAIKRIRHDAQVSAEHRERFRREARAVAALSHPAIVQVHDVVDDPSGHCIVMEYVRGPTVARMLGEGVLDLSMVVRLAREVAEGLAEAHDKGLVHRDLKSENVLVTPAGHAKILDFGLAKQTAEPPDDDSLTAAGAVVGTSRAMSPEQACGAPIDPRSDLFSLGVLLYEMATGRSPFRGDTPPETLRRLLSERQTPAIELRPSLPRQLSELIDRLLEKDPGDRPQSARRVALELAEIGETVGSSDRQTESLSLAPAAGGRPSWASRVGRARRRLEPTTLRHVRALATFGALLLTAVVVATGYLLWRQPPEPLRIAVLEPSEGTTGDPRLLTAATVVRTASLGRLAAMEGVEAIDPAAHGELPVSATELAAAVAADEVLAFEVEPWQGNGRVTLRRLRGRDGSVLWAESFEAPLESSEWRLLADSVALHLSHAYPDARLRPGRGDLEARAEDYAEFLALKRRHERDEARPRAELETLEGLLARSPRFLDGHLLASQLAVEVFQTGGELSYLERARASAERAEELAPSDPRPLEQRFSIALAAGEHSAAEAVLDRLEKLTPGNTELLLSRARLAEQRGDTGRALELLTEAVGRLPTRRSLLRLAYLEAREGRLDDARSRLERLLEITPDNRRARLTQAHLELVFGDLETAHQILDDLTREAPDPAAHLGLGLARALGGDLEAATASFQAAHALEPGYPQARFLLAAAEHALGQRARAAELFEGAATELRTGGNSRRDGMAAALCLAYLGHGQEAIELAQDVLRHRPSSPELAYQAAATHALVGDRTSALVHLRRAREAGLHPRWLSLPPFDPLRQDPDFLALTAAPPRAEQ